MTWNWPLVAATLWCAVPPESSYQSIPATSTPATSMVWIDPPLNTTLLITTDFTTSSPALIHFDSQTGAAVSAQPAFTSWIGTCSQMLWISPASLVGQCETPTASGAVYGFDLNNDTVTPFQVLTTLPPTSQLWDLALSPDTPLLYALWVAPNATTLLTWNITSTTELVLEPYWQFPVAWGTRLLLLPGNIFILYDQVVVSWVNRPFTLQNYTVPGCSIITDMVYDASAQLVYALCNFQEAELRPCHWDTLFQQLVCDSQNYMLPAANSQAWQYLFLGPPGILWSLSSHDADLAGVALPLVSGQSKFFLEHEQTFANVANALAWSDSSGVVQSSGNGSFVVVQPVCSSGFAILSQTHLMQWCLLACLLLSVV